MRGTPCGSAKLAISTAESRKRYTEVSEWARYKVMAVRARTNLRGWLLPRGRSRVGLAPLGIVLRYRATDRVRAAEHGQARGDARQLLLCRGCRRRWARRDARSAARARCLRRLHLRWRFLQQPVIRLPPGVRTGGLRLRRARGRGGRGVEEQPNRRGLDGQVRHGARRRGPRGTRRRRRTARPLPAHCAAGRADRCARGCWQCGPLISSEVLYQQ